MIHGSITALVTPFRDGMVDEQAFQSLVERQVAAGTHALVPCGTTGESPTLSHEEHRRVVSLCVEAARGRVPVIAGAGSNSTAEAIELMRHAKTVGADAALVVAPYYNRPSQEGLYQHFKALNDAVELPIIVYNIPIRSGVDISVDTMARIAELPNVLGVKDSAGQPVRAAEHRLRCGAHFVVLAGDDDLALGFAAYGAVGCISVASNVAPELCAEFWGKLHGGDFIAARAISDRLLPLARALFAEPSPAPVKYALARLGLASDEVRLPLVPASPAARARIDEALTGLGLL